MVLRPLGVHIQQNTHTDTHDTMIIIEFLLFIAFFIMLMWFHLAQGAKRCHDIDKSGWWQLIPFWNLILYFQDGVKGSNKYGENPKGRKL
jgi:uncharacterized membrane protein YhaH (DUF805 family)